MSTSAESPPVSRLFSVYLHGLAFLGGFNVMLLEMCAFRVLQTTFGSSIYVTGVLLALVMIALSGGYYLGGRFSQRNASLEFLLGVISLAVVYVWVTGGLLSEPLLDFSFGLRKVFSSGLAGHLVPPAVATLIFYMAPMLALSHVSPFLIRLLATNARGVGATAGNLMAVSNVGSIVGTTLPSFVLIPLLGVPTTLGIFIGSLGLVVVTGLVLVRKRAPVAALAGVVVIAAAVATPVAHDAWAARASAASARPVFESESLYGNVKIFRTQDDDGDEKLEFMPSRDYVHSTVYPGRPLKDQFTTAYANVGLSRGAGRYLILGTALGGVVSAILEANPQAKITAVEIDPLVMDLAQRYLPAMRSPNVRRVVEDARLFLREDTQEYDYIVVDIFSGEQIPAHCVSQEFFSLALARLAPDGVLQMNTNLWDFHITTGLEQPEPFVPVRHIHSALLRAGFASLFQSDFFEHGHVYAFRQATPEAEVRRALARGALDPAVEPNLRASYGMTALALVPIPDAERELRPFTDNWLPEHLLHLKDNFDQYLRALARARQLPEWKSQVEAAGDGQLRFISARHYADVGASGAPSYDGYRAYMKGDGGTAYCQEVLAWARQAPSNTLFLDLSRYLHTRVIHACERSLESQATALPAAGTSEGAFRRYVSAALLVDDNQGAKAVPLLEEILKAQVVL
ncbi:fused MFS/spermidine synthase [Corallococcus sp. bb12-1]|uniref:fused MFS/spermidine synthase n=1 Tax=Corallococcus sp. bb12-1 TaxID=2996784 RepID=UPI002270C311|nr:fused MFS/spermidine synthase [Corallococcus sp. bb12-1]MCY1042281.1 fused MFS/spermidine synthase [Corallococcus sp. bb12-1]